jgi:hypothetical protein
MIYRNEKANGVGDNQECYLNRTTEVEIDAGTE